MNNSQVVYIEFIAPESLKMVADMFGEL